MQISFLVVYPDMIKVLIIEDNSFIANILSEVLKENYPEIEVLGIGKNGEDGIKKVNHLNPDLVFLDIEMPDMTGFDMLNKLDNIRFQTIFTTAHSHYAIKAFRFNALDYLIKPVDLEDLSEALNRFKQKNQTKLNQQNVQVALDNLKARKLEDQVLLLNTQQGTLKIALKQIKKIEGDRNYSCIHLSSGQTELSSKTLGYFEDILEDKGFFRCHRSYLVNKLHINQIKNNKVFLLKDDSIVPISRRKMLESKDWFY